MSRVSCENLTDIYTLMPVNSKKIVIDPNPVLHKSAAEVPIAEITSKKIGEIVMKQLKSFDQVAYIRYASVYRSFKDVQTFQKELNQLLRKKKIRPRS